MGDFGIEREELIELFNDVSESRKIDSLEKVGGVDGLASKLRTSFDDGISSEDLQIREQVFGRNVCPEPKFTSFFELLFDALQDTTVVILIISAVISLSLGLLISDKDENHDGFEDKNTGWIEGTAILVAVTIVAFVTAGNDYSKEKQFRKLNRAKENKNVRVTRNGLQEIYSSYDLVVGDVVTLDTGDAIPADGILIQGFNLALDQSAMTGESQPIFKSLDSDVSMLSGSQVAEGVGKMVVTCVGPNSKWGSTLALLQIEHEPTPLQEKLEIVAATIGWIGLGAAILSFSIQSFFWFFKIWYATQWIDGAFPYSRLTDLVDFLIIAITIVVVAVPEGLPLAVTISLAYSVQKMMKDNNLVRKLEACETMGGATDICCDKTGTLTQNRMTVVEAHIGNKSIRVPKNLKEEFSEHVLDHFCENIAINSTAQVKEEAFVGNPTECALLIFTSKSCGYDYLFVKAAAKILAIESFSSQRKRMSTLVEQQKGGNAILYTKGAAEIIIDLCSHYVDASGKEVEISPQQRAKFNEVIKEMAQKGLRVISMAHRAVNHNAALDNRDELSNLENNLTLDAITGIQDPLRPETKDAIARCQSAGVVVRMVTGDNIDTAISIGRDAGIYTNGVVMEGAQFRALSHEKQLEIIPRLQILARSSPKDKYDLVNAIKELGGVCCVTGDGTNDAPALKAADVGLSMGICGTEVAKEASDIVLLDDNFASIVKAIAWGRCVYENIRKFLQFQLTVNFVALTTALIAALCEYGTPLTAVQLLWVNLIMDTMAALALATEPPSDKLLQRPPYGRRESLVSKTMWRNILSQAFLQLVIQYIVLVEGPELFGLVAHSRLHHTFSFNVFVFCQIFNEFNSRRIGNENDIFTGVFNNFMFVTIIFVTVIVQFIFVQFGGNFTQCAPLPSHLWLYSLFFGASSIVFGFVFRMIPVGGASKKIKKD